MGTTKNRKNKQGASELVGGVLFIAISLAAVIIVLGISMPKINSMKDTLAIEEAKETLTSLDRSIRDIAEESPGTARIIPVQIKKGKIMVDGDNDQIYYTIDTESETISSGTKRMIGNLWFESNTNTSLTNTSGRYILENSHLQVNISAYGTESIPVLIDPDDLIDSIYMKDTGKMVSDNITIHIDGESKTGTGHTWFDEDGGNLARATVYAFISNEDVNYTIRTTLDSGSDFLKIRVENIIDNE